MLPLNHNSWITLFQASLQEQPGTLQKKRFCSKSTQIILKATFALHVQLFGAAPFRRVVSAPLLLEEKGASSLQNVWKKLRYTSKMYEQFSLYSIMSLKTVVVRFIMTSFRSVSVVSFYLLALHYNTAAIITAVDSIYCRLPLQQQNFETKRFPIFWLSLYN